MCVRVCVYLFAQSGRLEGVEGRGCGCQNQTILLPRLRRLIGTVVAWKMRLSRYVTLFCECARACVLREMKGNDGTKGEENVIKTHVRQLIYYQCYYEGELSREREGDIKRERGGERVKEREELRDEGGEKYFRFHNFSGVNKYQLEFQ